MNLLNDESVNQMLGILSGTIGNLEREKAILIAENTLLKKQLELQSEKKNATPNK